MNTKTKMLEELRRMLNDVLVARTKGSSARLARAQGCVDGYMRALLDLGAATRDELLSLVAEERALVDGPALRVSEGESEAAA